MIAEPPSAYKRTAGDEPLPGYRLIAPLGRGGFGEVWKCLAPGGLQKAIKFVIEEADRKNDARTPLRQEYEAFLRVKGIRHPFLLTLERVELMSGELVMVMELADKNLQHRFEECQVLGLPGIPRGELLSYMVDAAEALDVLSRQHRLQHLDVKPANLFVVGGHVKVGDYGLVARFESGANGVKLGRGLTPKYVAPEILSEQIDPRSDQYTLGLVYFELLTGRFPFEATTAQEMLMHHASSEPNLEGCPTTDREALRRALAKKPAERFPTCLDFVKQLMAHPMDGQGTPISIPVPPMLLQKTTTLPSLTTTRSRSSEIVSMTSTVGSRTPSSHLNAALEKTSTGAGFYGMNATLRSSPLASTTDDIARLFPGYRLLDELEQSTRGRLVRVADATNRIHRMRLIKLGMQANGNAESVLRAAVTPHPHVIQTVSIPQPRLVVFTISEESTSLRELDRQAANAGQAIPKAEILESLALAAKTLDELHRKFHFAHGLLSPTSIIHHAKKSGITGYGIGELLRLTQTDHEWIQKDPYAAPEALRGEAAPASDIFSLAMIYLELVRIWAPPSRRSGAAHPIPYAHLPEHERHTLRKALATKPNERFANCAEFISTLNSGPRDHQTLDEVRFIENVSRLNGDLTQAPIPMTVENFVGTLLKAIPTPQPHFGRKATSAVKQPDGRWAIRFPVFLTLDILRLKLEAFCQERHLETVTINPETLLYRRAALLGKPGLELTIQLPTGSQWHAAEITVFGRTLGGMEPSSREVPAEVVEHLEAFRRTVQTHDDRRVHQRRRTDLPIILHPVSEDLRLGTPLAARGRDLSASGMSFYLPETLSATHVFASFPGVEGIEPWAILCQIVRTTADAGQHLIAAKFLG